MSYEGTTCPCGGKKESNTMLCSGCMDTFAGHSAMTSFLDRKGDVETRRNAAMILLALARGRQRQYVPKGAERRG